MKNLINSTSEYFVIPVYLKIFMITILAGKEEVPERVNRLAMSFSQVER